MVCTRRTPKNQQDFRPTKATEIPPAPDREHSIMNSSAGSKRKREFDLSEHGCRTYRGNCHCKAFVYEVQLPEIHDATQCNCSICHKKGYLWLFIIKSQFKIVKGSEESLTSYQFGPKLRIHKFCSTCATPIMATHTKDDTLAINARAIQGIDTWSLTRTEYDGSSVGEDYSRPKHKGPSPPTISGHRLYTGSCHCGAVTIALMSTPIDETFKGLTTDCNCSICVRNGYLWTYPAAQNVRLLAQDPTTLGRYSFSRHILNKTFCRACGVCMTNEYANRSEDERKALGAVAAGKFAQSMKTQHPVNLRTFPDVELCVLKPPKRNNGARFISPRYVDP